MDVIGLVPMALAVMFAFLANQKQTKFPKWFSFIAGFLLAEGIFMLVG